MGTYYGGIDGARQGGWTHMDDINARARLLAVEVLLAEPELLGNDALETDLYILRDTLLGAPDCGRGCE